MKSNKSKYAILGLLSHSPASGYDLRRLVDENISHFWNESFGQIYPILKRLTVERMARRKVERQSGKPDRQVYSLTDRGFEELAGWLVSPAEFQVARNETLLKLFFGDRIGIDESEAHVHRYRDHFLQQLDEYTELERLVEEEESGSSDLPFWLMTISHGKHQARAAIRWADETLRELERMRGKKKPESRRKR